MIRNMDTDPNGLLIRYKWGGRYERRSDGKGTYYGDGNAYMGTVRTHLAVPVGNIVMVIAQTVDEQFSKSKIYYSEEVLDYHTGDIYVKAARATTANKYYEVNISACTNGVTILGSGIYTPDDWDEILELHTSGVLQYPWISGETLRGGGYLSSGFLARPHLDCEVCA